MSIPVISRVWLEVDVNKIRYNYKRIKNSVTPAQVMVVLKANAYGLGLESIIPELIRAGVKRVGVAEIKEALPILKKHKLDVQLLGSLLKKELPLAIKMNLICPLTDLGMAKSISRESIRQKKSTRCHLLIDTGMGRLGIPYFEAEHIINQIKKLPGLNIEGIYSHFANANNVKHPKTKTQLKIFNSLLKKINFPIPLVHIANSDGINNFPESHFNLVRTGINLYGVFDLMGRHRYQLKPTLSLKTRLIARRTLPKGYTIGYGSTHVLKKTTTVGTIAAGYADGIPYSHSAKGGILIRGRVCRVIGRVSMDYVTVDLANCPAARPGDTAVIFGKSGNNSISVEEWAKTKGTHPYDIICSLGNRVQRIYKS